MPRATEPRRLRALAAGAAAVLALTACGGTDTETTSTDDGDTAQGTTPETPLDLGSSVEALGWTVTITGVDLDATDEIMEATGMLATEPDPGHQYAMVTYEGTYDGDDPENSFRTDLVVTVWIDGVFYDDCGANVPPGYNTGGAVEQGGTASSAACAQIPTDGADRALVHLVDWQPISQPGFYFTTA
ncbi:hypothetical protein LO763_15975 [Glycomyces sp. A-F 0318]|uniref:hypothetical protein n=1 Tax=Glycomyces amatae TaxID=2881355 RepID=UPI001E5978A0|nr:hypothetical protein [Glycomyces amatae]MCD0445115.1 hypothetical protein [Glycomyces amatae]